MLTDDETARRDLTLAEFSSLRAESAAAKQNQQSVFQWSLASIGAVWGATAAFASPELLFISLAIVIPIIAGCGFAVWVGEVHRMERAGKYLRARERAFNARPQIPFGSPLAPERLPIMWESLIYGDTTRPSFGKDLVGNFGAMTLFTTAFYGSWFGSLFSTPESFRTDFTIDFLGIETPVWSFIAPVAYLVIFVPILLRIRQHSHGRLPDPSDASLPEGVTVGIVAPCLNESSAIPWIASRRPKGTSMILVDNGSVDYSPQLAEALHFNVCRTVPGTGLGAATLAGIACANSDIVCVVDCDGTIDLAEIGKLVEPVASGEIDLAIGIRSWSWAPPAIWHRFLTWVRWLMMRVRLGPSSPRQVGSVQVFRKSALSSEAWHKLAGDFGWSLDLALTFLETRGLERVTYVPMNYLPRIGRSKVTGTWRGLWRTVRDSRRVISAHRSSTREIGLLANQ